MRVIGRASATIALSLLLSSDLLAQGALLERALLEFWSEKDLSDREKDATALEKLDAPFDTLYARLETGRTYSKDVKTGLVEESRKGLKGLRQEYVFVVPEDYDPKNRYRVCFYLHGGVNRGEPWKKGESWWRRFDRFDGSPQISVFPASWRGSLWWQSSQIENLDAILQRLKTEYNVDENRVYLYGVSDGGTGAYYHAMKAPTNWAAIFPFIGHPGVLDNAGTGVDGIVFLANFRNRPFYIVSGEQDRLYPAAQIRPYVEALQKEGVELTFRTEPGGHNTRWWNGQQEDMERFMADHVRDPLPDHLVWMTERTDRFARIHWLVIEELEDQGEQSVGRIELTRHDNRVEVQAEGVSRYRLLLSPRELDFALPVEVVTNGVSSFRGNVTRSSRTLLQWAAKDLDRTMLFAAELEIAVSAAPETPR